MPEAYVPSLEEVSEKWEAMFDNLAHDLGCICEVSRGPTGWGAKIYDPEIMGGASVSRFNSKEEAIRACVARWEILHENAVKVAGGGDSGDVGGGE